MGFFLLLILFPDISAIGFLVNERIGNSIYNVAHSYVTISIIFLFTKELFWFEFFFDLAHSYQYGSFSWLYS
ncbi:DUF4260 family protein [Staphylococcus pseudintermedius]|nr:DUF4260 family protein [Staphylococcus pseudintermedius]